jgi:hypothetical protein
MAPYTRLAVQVHQPSGAEAGAMERAGDLLLDVTVEDDLVIARKPEDASRDYAVEIRVLIRTLGNAMYAEQSRNTTPAAAAIDPEAALEKAWHLAEFVMGAITHTRPDWFAIELCANELAELATNAPPPSGD